MSTTALMDELNRLPMRHGTAMRFLDTGPRVVRRLAVQAVLIHR